MSVYVLQTFSPARVLLLVTIFIKYDRDPGEKGLSYLKTEAKFRQTLKK